MALKIANLPELKNDPYLYKVGEAIESLAQAHENLSYKLSVNSQGDTQPPAPHSAIAVTAKNGITHIALTDHNPRTSAVPNFVEGATSKDFSDAQPIHLGAGRQVRIPTFMGST